MVNSVGLGIASRGTLDKNAASLGEKVDASHYETAKSFLSGLDDKATVRIVNGRSKGKSLELGTKSNAGNFYSRKPVTKEFFKQACIARFSNAADVGQAFDEAYAAGGKGATLHSARHFLGVLATLEQRFAAPSRNTTALLAPRASILVGGGVQAPAEEHLPLVLRRASEKKPVIEQPAAQVAEGPQRVLPDLSIVEEAPREKPLDDTFAENAHQAQWSPIEISADDLDGLIPDTLIRSSLANSLGGEWIFDPHEKVEDGFGDERIFDAKLSIIEGEPPRIEAGGADLSFTAEAKRFRWEGERRL